MNFGDYTISIDTTPISIFADYTGPTTSYPLTDEQMRILGLAWPGPLDALVTACKDLAAACREYTEAWQ